MNLRSRSGEMVAAAASCQSSSQVFILSRSIVILILIVVYLILPLSQAKKEPDLPPLNLWTHPDQYREETRPQPLLGLSFIHMRKAGGTTFLELLKSWMKR